MNDLAYDDEPAGPGIGALLSHLPTILKERKWWIIIPSILGVVAAALAILLVKPVYEADALMLVQSAQVQDEILNTLDTEVVDRRIARIRAEVISRPNLVALIERHRLYADERRDEPLSQIIETMREDITLSPTTAQVAGNSRDERTIAFRLAYQYEQPQQAQAVTQDLMDRILELDSEGNVERGTNTVQFLTDQSTDLEARIAEVEQQITQFTAANGLVIGGGGMVSTSSGSYDVQIGQLQRDNAMLIAQKSNLQTADTRDPVVLQAEAALASARAVYAENHPDVVQAKQRLAQARELAKSNVTKIPTQTLDQQIAFNNQQIALLRSAKAQEEGRVSAQLAAQSRGPAVQQRLAQLQTDLNGLNTQYQDIQTRLASARAGVKAEDEQVAERLSVVEPPIVPDEPVWPNRLLILAVCIGGGIGLGIVLAVAIEIFFRPVRDPDSLAAITGETPLAVVPILEPRKLSARGGWRRFIPGLSTT